LRSPHPTRHDGARLWLAFRREEVSAPDLIARVSNRYRIRDLRLEEPDIEEVVRHIYEEGLPGATRTPLMLAGR
jgi:ABC-2 type transport system ATP-binding protein